ncbi:MAG: heme ABC exporter ATP-binding protein CcmA [Gammaproteobacteria bacterium]|nr:heme ABC exporter ATP-binding protein CcmA [Gammaproteobacteria bacterium]
MIENELEVIELSCIRQAKPIFSAISFQLAAGEAMIVVAPNGAGKSSLLRLAAGLATPFLGEIKWRGKTIQQTSYQENLHYLSHLNGIKLGLTVKENLQLAKRLHRDDQPFSSFNSMLSFLQLTAHENVPAFYLSAGQKRRLALARIFLFPKPIWILDEPLTALDNESQTFFLSQLAIHLQTGGIALMSSHHAISPKNVAIKSLQLIPHHESL